jgi:hypothetical protein
MRTTIDIPNEIMERLKAYVDKSGLSMKEVVTKAITLFFSKQSEIAKSKFVLDDCSVDGKGLNPDFQASGWEAIRGAIYDDIS